MAILATASGSRRRLGLGVAAGFGLVAISTASDDGPTLCPFALVTGLACPGCGMTRAVSRLVRGDLTGAFDYHPLVFLVAALAIFGGAWYLARRQNHRPAISTPSLNVGLATIGAAFLAVWLARLASGTLPVV